MPFNGDKNKNMENNRNSKTGKRVILSDASQISDDDVADILQGKKKITEIHFGEAVKEPDKETFEKPKVKQKRKKKTVESRDNVNPDVNVSGPDYTEDAVAASLEETAAALRSRIFGDNSGFKTDDANGGSQEAKVMEVEPPVEEISVASLENVSSDELYSEGQAFYDRGTGYIQKESTVNTPLQSTSREDGGTTVRYNPEMVIEEFRRPDEGYNGADNEVRTDRADYFNTGVLSENASIRTMPEAGRKSSSKGGYRPITTSSRVYAYGLDEIPNAVSQLTKRAKLNETFKVSSRARKLEKAGAQGRIEDESGEVLTFEFEGMSNAHVMLDNDTIFQYENMGEIPPGARRRIRKKSGYKRKRRPHGPVFRIISALLLILIVFACISGYDFAKKVCDDRAMDSKDLSKISYTVDENTTDDEVADFLVKNGMVESQLYYKLRAILFEADYKPGTYEISPSYSTEKIINILSGYDYSAGNQ